MVSHVRGGGGGPRGGAPNCPGDGCLWVPGGGGRGPCGTGVAVVVVVHAATDSGLQV